MAEEDSGAEGAEKKEEAAPKKKLPLLQIALLGQLVLMLAAGALLAKVSLFAKRPDMSDKVLRERAIASVRDEAADIQVLDLAEFAVNLSRDKVLKATVQIEVSDPKTAKLVRRRISAVRARVLDVLARQQPDKAASLQGKLMIKDAIRETINDELVGNGESKGVVREVYFMDFNLI